MATMEIALAALREHFGFEDFREGQREVIDAVLNGRDTVVVMPTGGGKSLCYQLPAMIKDGATVVVSPLIALMKDQVDALHARNLPATFINSSIDFEEQRARLQAVRRGQYKLVYVAPERFRSQHFVEVLQSARVALFAIDEAHCISQWGHDFRPDYLRLKEVIERVGRPQVIALTATATPHVRSDIIEQLGLHEPHAIVSGFDRPNLSINVVQTHKEPEKILHIKALAARKGSGIIYTSTRKAVEQVAAKLVAAGLAVVAYHAGMTDEERNEAQENFMTGRTQMIVATNAFGMGIDKPDIRFVAHYHMPGSIEAYYQEIGRAGRDGLPSTCTLLFNYADKRTHDFFIEGSYPPPDIIGRVYQALVGTNQKRIELSTKEIAQRAGVRNEMSVQSALIILEKAGHIERGASGENRAAVRLRMSPQQAREKIEARRSTQMRQVLWGLLGGYDVNQKADTELDVEEFAETVGLDSQAVRRAVSSLTEAGIITYQAARRTRGVLLLDEHPVRQLRIKPAEIARRAALEQRKVREMISFCYTDRCFRAHILDYFNDRHHAAICGTCGNCAALENRGTQQTPRVPSLEPPTQLDEFVMEHSPFALDLEHELSEATRLRHAQEAAEARHDFSNDVINVTEARELTDEEKLRVRKVLACAARMNGRFGKNLLAATLRGSRSGKVVEAKLDQLSTYGILRDLSQEEVLAYIDALVAARCLTIKGGAYPTVSLSALGGEVMRERAEIKLALSVAAAPTVRAPHQSPQLHKPSSMQNGAGKQSSTVDETYALYEAGLPIEQISKQRSLTEITIEKHLAQGIAEGRAFDLALHVSDLDRRLIEAAVNRLGTELLKPLRDALPPHITYRMIRFVVALLQRAKHDGDATAAQ